VTKHLLIALKWIENVKWQQCSYLIFIFPSSLPINFLFSIIYCFLFLAFSLFSTMPFIIFLPLFHLFFMFLVFLPYFPSFPLMIFYYLFCTMFANLIPFARLHPQAVRFSQPNTSAPSARLIHLALAWPYPHSPNAACRRPRPPLRRLRRLPLACVCTSSLRSTPLHTSMDLHRALLCLN
jgi:hypothetical protein